LSSHPPHFIPIPSRENTTPVGLGPSLISSCIQQVRAVVFFWFALASGARERTEPAGWSAGLGRFGARQAWRSSGSADETRSPAAGSEAGVSEDSRQCGRWRRWCPRTAPRWSTVITSSSASLPDVPTRERPQGAGSVCLLGPVRCVRRTLAAAASGVGLRGRIRRRPCVAGWVPMPGWAAGETRPSSGTTDEPGMGSGGSRAGVSFTPGSGVAGGRRRPRVTLVEAAMRC